MRCTIAGEETLSEMNASLVNRSSISCLQLDQSEQCIAYNKVPATLDAKGNTAQWHMPRIRWFGTIVFRNKRQRVAVPT